MVAALIAALTLAAPPVTHDVIPVFVSPPGTNGGTDYEYAWTSGTSPISLGVFRRPRTPADIAPRVTRFFARSVGGDLSRSRLLLASGKSSIYAFPARTHQVCWVRTPDGTGGCERTLIHGAYPEVEPRHDVWGIVDDGAARVDVDGRRAKLGRNAFFLPLTVIPAQIVVYERNGARHVYEIKRCTSLSSC